MATMNHESFNNVLKTLDISTVELTKKLFVSQSLISRWKTGSRKLKTDSSYYDTLLHIFLEVNASHNMHELESLLFLDHDNFEKENYKKELYHQLNVYLQSPDHMRYDKNKIQELSGFKTYIGMDQREQALRNFFEYALSLKSRPDIYLMEIDNARWYKSSTSWVMIFEEYGLKYMDEGGKILYFSNLYNIDRDEFYDGWTFTSHPNLYPAYSIDVSDQRIGCAYYLLKGHMSVSFYVPEADPSQYYTAVHTDPETLEAQQQYIQQRFNQRNQQIFLNTITQKTFAFNTLKINEHNIQPVVIVGKYPGFLFLSLSTLQNVLSRNNISGQYKSLCIQYHNFFHDELMKNTVMSKTLFYYKEDLDNAAQEQNLLDLELSVIAGTPIFINHMEFREALKNLASLTTPANNSRIFIISKQYKPVYEKLGENRTIWLKNGKWYFIFYDLPNNVQDGRLITENLASIIRVDMYQNLLREIPSYEQKKYSHIDYLNSLLQQD